MTRRRWLFSAGFFAFGFFGCATMFPPGPKPVSFQSTPPGAEVVVDGQVRGTTPLALDLSCTTPRLVAFRLAGYDVYEQRLGTVPGYDGRATMTWPVEQCQPVVQVVLKRSGS